MKLAKVGIIAAVVLAMSSIASAQTTRPDFSGRWEVDTSAAPATPPAGAPPAEGRGRGMAPGPMTVTVTGNKLTIERTMGENKVVTVYNLDGTESVNKMMGRGGTEIETKSTTKWDENKLVITTQRQGPDGTMVTSTETWALNGSVLTIEGTRPGRDGNPQTTTRVYKKST